MSGKKNSPHRKSTNKSAGKPLKKSANKSMTESVIKSGPTSIGQLMQKPSAHDEQHLTHRAGWLRAAVLGANDGIISVASLVVGVAAATLDKSNILVAGVAGLCAGALSMATGEYVSVSSQADIEKADLDKERKELERIPDIELNELAAIYEWRGLPKKLARQVAIALTKHNALDAHARDELGITDFSSAQPLQASVTSAISFSVGAIIPLLMVIIMPENYVSLSVILSSILALALLGALGAKLGGADNHLTRRAVGRVVLWGVLAMAVTLLVGKLFGAVI
ncbi:MAG: VIT family protein [Hydrotalea sp.]|nr:VIT family protein [Hydrotalea sp.]